MTLNGPYAPLQPLEIKALLARHRDEPAQVRKLEAELKLRETFYQTVEARSRPSRWWRFRDS